jgi:hypothetical protein
MSITFLIADVSVFQFTHSLHRQREPRPFGDVHHPTALMAKRLIQRDIEWVKALVKRNNRHIIRSILLTARPRCFEPSFTLFGLSGDSKGEV